MSVSAGYNKWSRTYDTMVNKTRDLEGRAFRSIMQEKRFNNVLEIGCGTGKNTIWLAEHSEHITAVDGSIEMISKAKEKISSANVTFVHADILQPWTFGGFYDLITFSLILEHIEHLKAIFTHAFQCCSSGGYLYLGELHPARQYPGTKARYESDDGQVNVLECYTHHVSDFYNAATAAGFMSVKLNEWFDENTETVPRILTMVFQKP
jgi:ubiquinone/menaquinone biosynthesis C-methylase UbiE